MPLHEPTRFVFRSKSAASALAPAAAALAMTLAGCSAHHPPAPIPMPPVAQALHRPDVQVLIVPSIGGDSVDLTYPGVVPPAQAERDVTAILHAGGWHTTDVDISNDSLPITNKTVAMTSVTFETSGATPAAGDSTLRLEPWIVGLRSYAVVAVTYLMPVDFRFNGLRSYQDDRVQIALDQEQSTLTYHVRILDGGRFTNLGLPLAQPMLASVPPSPTPRRRLSLIGIVLVSLAAAGVGYSVYALVSRLR